MWIPNCARGKRLSPPSTIQPPMQYESLRLSDRGDLRDDGDPDARGEERAVRPLLVAGGRFRASQRSFERLRAAELTFITGFTLYMVTIIEIYSVKPAQKQLN